MASRVNIFFHQLVQLLRSENEPSHSAELTREFADLRMTTLNLLMAFLAVHAISASHALGVTSLALLVYAINLHIVANIRFLQGNFALTKFLHTIPLLGIVCMAIFRLLELVQSPAIATCVLLACALPPLLTAAQFAKRYAEVILMPLPVQMRDMGPTDTTALPDQR